MKANGKQYYGAADRARHGSTAMAFRPDPLKQDSFK